MSASGHSKNGMLALYQSQSRLSQKVWASRSFCLSRTWADAGAMRTVATTAAKSAREYMFQTEWELFLDRKVCWLYAGRRAAKPKRPRLEIAHNVHLGFLRNLVLHADTPVASVNQEPPQPLALKILRCTHCRGECPARLAVLGLVALRPG